MASHDEIAKKFGTRQINSRTKKVEWSASRVYCEDDLIFSYGGHFPMAKYLGEHPKHGHYFIKNSDKYSSSTSAHQSCVRQHCFGPEVSRSHLSCFVYFTDLTMDNIYLWRPGAYHHMWQDSETRPGRPQANVEGGQPSAHVYIFAKPCKPSRFGTFKSYRKQDHRRFQQGMFTVQQVLVLKVKSKYLLCTDGSIVELDGQPKTISESLKLGKRARKITVS